MCLPDPRPVKIHFALVNQYLMTKCALRADADTEVNLFADQYSDENSKIGRGKILYDLH